MITDLRDAFTSMLAGVTWMDEITRKLAIAKVWRNMYFVWIRTVCVTSRVCVWVCVCARKRVCSFVSTV